MCHPCVRTGVTHLSGPYTLRGRGGCAIQARMAEAGFVFWGVFAAFGLLVVGYVIWMKWVERP